MEKHTTNIWLVKQTLGGLSSNFTGIPMPASAMKRSNSNSNMQQSTGFQHGRSTSGSRMSLAPGRPSQPIFQRSSSGNNLGDLGFASVQRHSSIGFGSAGGRKSFAPGALLATPAQDMQSETLSTQRRSSVFKTRSSSGIGAQMASVQSFFQTAPLPAGQVNDPRRLKDASVRQHMAAELMEYLTMNNFEMEMKHQLSQKSMTSPTQKDFNCMFQWLYKRIDPGYKFMKNIDAEVPPLLKQMRYPFEKNIMKSAIAAVGGNNWYIFLGLLHWMMQLAKMMEQYSTGIYDEASQEAGYDVHGDRIMWDFLAAAYGEWGQNEDEDEYMYLADPNDDEETKRKKEVMAKDALVRTCKPQIDAMEAKFEKANEQHLEQLRMLEAENKALQDQIDDLQKSAPRIAKLDEQIRILEEDRVKFEQYNASIETKVDRYRTRLNVLEDEIQKTDKELEDNEQEKANLQDVLDSQGITMQDIDRMNSERERLQKALEVAGVRMEESKRKVTEKEMEASQKLDDLERTVEKYNALGYQVGVIPSTATNARGLDYELVLTVNEGPNFSSSQMGNSQNPESDRLLADSGNGYQAHHLLNLDIKGALKNNIMSLRKDIRDRRNNNLEVDMNNHDLLDKVKEVMDEKQADVEALGHRVRAAEEEFEKTREVRLDWYRIYGMFY